MTYSVWSLMTSTSPLHPAHPQDLFRLSEGIVSAPHSHRQAEASGQGWRHPGESELIISLFTYSYC